MQLGKLIARAEPTWKPTDLGDVEVLVIGLRDRAFRDYYAKLQDEPDAKKAIRAGGKRKREMIDALFIKALARKALHGWKGITEDDDTTPVEFTPDKAIELLTESNAFYDNVVAACGEVDAALVADEEKAEGNSARVSGSPSSGGHA